MGEIQDKKAYQDIVNLIRSMHRYPLPDGNMVDSKDLKHYYDDSRRLELEYMLLESVTKLESLPFSFLRSFESGELICKVHPLGELIYECLKHEPLFQFSLSNYTKIVTAQVPNNNLIYAEFSEQSIWRRIQGIDNIPTLLFGSAYDRT